MSKFDQNRIKHGWEKLCTNKQTDRQTDTTKIMVTWPWTNKFTQSRWIITEVFLITSRLREIAVLIVMHFLPCAIFYAPSLLCQFLNSHQIWNQESSRPVWSQSCNRFDITSCCMQQFSHNRYLVPWKQLACGPRVAVCINTCGLCV